MNIIKKIGLATINNNCLLVVRNENTTKFLMPGGRVEKGEKELDTLIREIKEELSCNMDISTVKYLGEFEDFAANDPGKKVNIKLYLGNLNGNIEKNNEIEEIKWFDYKNDNIEILSDIVKNKILPFLISNKYL